MGTSTRGAILRLLHPLAHLRRGVAGSVHFPQLVTQLAAALVSAARCATTGVAVSDGLIV